MEGSATATPTAPSAPAADAGASNVVTSESKPGVTVQTSTKADKPDTGKSTDGGDKPTKAEVAEAIRKFKLKVDGAEQEFDERTVMALAQKGMAADKRFNEAATIRKQNEALIRLLKTDPAAVLAHPDIGVDVRKWAEEFLYKRLQHEQMTPEEREREEMKSKLSEFEREKKERAEAEEAAKFEKLKEEYRTNIQEGIIKALDGSGLPKTPFTVRRMAHHLLESRLAAQKYFKDTGVRIEPLDPADVVDLVWQDYTDEHNQLLGALPADKILSLLKDDVRKKIREAELAAAKGGTTSPPKPLSAQDQPPASEENRPARKKLTIQEWRERNRKLMDEGE